MRFQEIKHLFMGNCSAGIMLLDKLFGDSYSGTTHD